MNDTTKLEIILAARNASQQAFAEYRRGITDIGQSFNQLKGIVGGMIGAGGALMAVRTGFEAMIDGAAAAKQAEAFGNLAQSVGSDSGKIIKDLKKVSQGFVGETELVKAAGTAMMMGLNPDELVKMMQIAQATSRQTGQTVTEAFDDITRGVARQSKMILDNLGIIVDVEKANERYAQQLGKTSQALTDAEKRQAFMNDVIAKGDELVKRIGSSGGAYDNINKMAATHSDLWSAVGTTIANIVERNLPLYLRGLDAVTKKLNEINAASAESDRRDQMRAIEQSRRFQALPWGGALGTAWTGDADKLARDYMARYEDPRRKRLDARGGYDIPSNEWKGMAAWKYREGQWVDFTDAEKKAMVDAREKWLRDQEAAAKKTVKAAEDIWAGWNVRPGYSEAERADQERFEEWRRDWAGFNQRPYQESEAMLADQQRWEEWKKSGEDSMNAMMQLSERTADAMEQNFSDLFFDAFKGELKSAEDYFQAFSDTIARIAADLAGQMLKSGLFGSSQNGQQVGGLLGSLFSYFGGSSGQPEQLGQYNKLGNVFGPAGVQRFAAGGVVTRPTVFPFARGIGLMGEDGPEAILPLKRGPGGRLGVEAAGGGTQVIVNNYGAERATAKETRGPDNTRQIFVTIGADIVAGGPIARSIESTYGLRRAGRIA